MPPQTRAANLHAYLHAPLPRAVRNERAANLYLQVQALPTWQHPAPRRAPPVPMVAQGYTTLGVALIAALAVLSGALAVLAAAL